MTEDGEVEPEKVAMTAPVRTEQPQGTLVAMTSPVRTELKSSLRNMRVSFVMPKKASTLGCRRGPFRALFVFRFFSFVRFSATIRHPKGTPTPKARRPTERRSRQAWDVRKI